MRIQYCEESEEECGKCGRRTGEYMNIGLWKQEPRNINKEPPDKVLCLRCSLNNGVKSEYFEEFAFEGEPTVNHNENTLLVTVDTIAGVSLHVFNIDINRDKWVDPDSRVTSAGPPKRTQNITNVNIKSSKAELELIAPFQEKVDYRTDYWSNYVKRYVKNNPEKF